MKNILFIALVTVVFACNSEKKTNNETQENHIPKAKTEAKTNVNSNSVGMVSNFLLDVKALETIKGENPIALFQKLAADKASKVLTVSKDNIESILSLAKTYKNCVITTGDHTIVKIVDINNCKPSGSWGACMPFANGYIKKGDLMFQEDYINNIIGIPDSQVRHVYFFD